MFFLAPISVGQPDFEARTRFPPSGPDLKPTPPAKFPRTRPNLCRIQPSFGRDLAKPLTELVQGCSNLAQVRRNPAQLRSNTAETWPNVAQVARPCLSRKFSRAPPNIGSSAVRPGPQLIEPSRAESEFGPAGTRSNPNRIQPDPADMCLSRPKCGPNLVEAAQTWPIAIGYRLNPARTWSNPAQIFSNSARLCSNRGSHSSFC